MNLDRLDAQEVVRFYLLFHVHRAYPPSCSGISDMPAAPYRPDDSVYDDLVTLMRGVSSEALQVLLWLHHGYTQIGIVNKEPVMPEWEWKELHPDSDVPYVDLQGMILPTYQMIADRMGVTRQQVARIANDAYLRVAENIGERKAKQWTTLEKQ